MAIDRDKIARSAQRYKERRQFQRAIDEYKKVLAADSRDIRTRLKLIELYGLVGRKREAVDECLLVAETYADQGFYLKAIAVYKQALRVEPDNPVLYRNMGEMYVKQGLIGDALGWFKRGVDVLRRQERQSEAEELLIRMEELAPENVAIKIHLAELYLEEDKYQEFSEEFSKLVLQLRGEGRSRKLLQAVESFYEKSQRHQVVLQKLAELYVDLGEESKALEVLREGLGREPQNRELRLLALRANLSAGQLPEARKIALGLYEEDPNDLFILEQLAAIAQARGDKSELAQAFKAVAKVYGRRGLHQKEEFYFRKVLEISPEDAEARLHLGSVMVEVTPEPVEEQSAEVPGFEQEWGAEPASGGDDDLQQGLVEAELYLKYGIDQKAAEKLRELTEIAPEDVEIRQKLRDLFQRQGDRDGWTQEQLKIAEIFRNTGRENEAFRAYEAILEVDGGNEQARRAMQQLKPHAPAAQAAEREPAPIGIEFVDESVDAAYGAPGGEATEEEQALRRGLSRADTLTGQGRRDEAIEVLLQLRGHFPASVHVATRLESLGWSPEEPGDEEGDFVDLQAEVLEGLDLRLGSEFEGFEDFEVSELDDIVREFKSGIAERLEDSDFETHYNLGVAYREMGLFDEALQEFQMAARSPERQKDAYTSLSLVLRDLGRHGDALAALRMALASPDNAAEDRVAILYEMGCTAEEAGTSEQAVQFFEKASEVDPSYRDVGGRLRQARARLGA